MSKKQTRTCCVCHKDYNFCPICNPEDSIKPNWYFAYCSENCKDIYKVASDYENGEIDADEAKSRLKKLDIINLETFGESYQSTIARINKETLSSRKEKNKDATEKIIKNEETVESIKNYKKPSIKKVLNVGEVE